MKTISASLGTGIDRESVLYRIIQCDFKSLELTFFVSSHLNNFNENFMYRKVNTSGERVELCLHKSQEWQVRLSHAV